MPIINRDRETLAQARKRAAEDPEYARIKAAELDKFFILFSAAMDRFAELVRKWGDGIRLPSKGKGRGER